MSRREPTTVSAPPPVAATVAELPVPPEVRAIVEAMGVTALYPPQAGALGPALRGESVLLSCPTASGKSLVGYLALLKAVRDGGTGLVLVPLRAIAQEKYDDLRQFEPLGVRVGLSLGDFDLAPSKLDALDILVATSEKADSLLRRGPDWLDRLGCVVVDEVHLLRDPERGPTLEVSLTRLRRRRPSLQVVALSATVGNAPDLADWLRATLIESDFRPVPLRSGVYLDGRVTFTDLSTRSLPPPGDAVPRLVRTIVQEGGQALVFVNTRKGSESLAEALGPTVRPLLASDDLARRRDATGALAVTGEEETEGVRRLTRLFPNGVAYHNASLTNGERRVVERAFRERVLKALVATPTLAAGINLPARRVIVRDTSRYDEALGGQAPIPALEVQQMCGRAGRPGLDRTGEAILVARSEEEVERYLDQYLSARPEEVRSQLAREPSLRMHLLALVASGAVASEGELEQFFQATYFGHTRPVSELDATVRSVRSFLTREGFLVDAEALAATPFGALTSELYLDPLSAVVLRGALERAPIGVGAFPLLVAAAATPDLPPLFLRRGEEKLYLDRFVEEEPELLVKPEEEPLRTDLESFLGIVKTAAVLEAWIDETPIVELTERFGIGAGDLRAKVEDAEWILFGATRIAQTFFRKAARPADALSLRVRYGIREELLDLVHLRGIGRARGRALYRAGFPDRESLRAASVSRLEGILGSRELATNVLRQVGGGPSVGGPPDVAPRKEADAPSRSRRRGARAPSRTLEEFPVDP